MNKQNIWHSPLLDKENDAKPEQAKKHPCYAMTNEEIANMFEEWAVLRIA